MYVRPNEKGVLQKAKAGDLDKDNYIKAQKFDWQQASSVSAFYHQPTLPSRR